MGDLKTMKTVETVVEIISDNATIPIGVSNLVCMGNCGCVGESTDKVTCKIVQSILLPLVLFSIINFSLIFRPVAAHAGKHAYPEFLPTISYEVVEVLIKHGMPVRHDSDNPWFWTLAIPGSYTIRLYRADEIPQQAVLDVIKLCLNFYEQRERRERFRIQMYHETAKERRESVFFGIGSFARIKPFFELTIGRKEK